MNWLSDNVNQLALIGATAIVLITIFVVGKYIKQIKDDRATGELTEESWDGIREFKNPIPVGWGLAFLGTIIWGIWYWLVGYPLNAYSQIGEYNDEVKAYNEKFEAKWANPDKKTLMEMGGSIYLVQCSPCHGITGDGIDGKAAGFDRWGTAKGVADVIKNGSKGLGYPMGDMPGGLVSDPAEIEAVSNYVAAGLSGDAKGAEVYAANCASCHGDDGKGLGGQSPDLTTYGTTAFVKDVLERGKDGDIGMMPAFNDGRLTDIQKEAVSTYILSLGEK